MRLFLILFQFFIFFHFEISGQMKARADMILMNAKIYTADKNFSIGEACAIGDGKFLAIGTKADILGRFNSGKVIDARGKPVYPGFIDGHCHFYGYALSLQQVDLNGLRSFEEVLATLQKKSGEIPGEWLVGRGWDHNKWPGKKFPDRSLLDKEFPGRPVVLIRVDGHVVLANGEALKRAGIGLPNSFQPGEVEVKNGTLTGILSENAADRMRNTIPATDMNILSELLQKAQQNCFAAGLTGVSDAGLEFDQVQFIDSLQKNGILKMHVYAMLEPSGKNIENFINKGIYKTSGLTIRSVKVYSDGSLGSRTALLKQPYSDDPGKTGILANSVDSIKKICQIAYVHGYQVNTHAIGDSAVRIVLEIYSKFLKGKNDLRWRIEHSQVVDPLDMPLFRKYCIIPSIQSTHATSDMYWAGERLGSQRIKWAYAYKELLEQNGWLPNGTDFPIESISPIQTFYAAVARKDNKGFPESGFQKENSLSREEALRSVTIWAAKANFDENEMGSIEPGKRADFVILEKDIMTLPETELPSVKVSKLFIGGVKMYENNTLPE
jgi:predicted amidohydrolase YtcJ